MTRLEDTHIGMKNETEILTNDQMNPKSSGSTEGSHLYKFLDGL